MPSVNFSSIVCHGQKGSTRQTRRLTLFAEESSDVVQFHRENVHVLFTDAKIGRINFKDALARVTENSSYLRCCLSVDNK